MRSLATLACLIFLGIVMPAQTAKEKVMLKTEEDKVSYSIGFSFAKNLKMNSIEVDIEKLTAGIVDGLSHDSSSVCSDSEMTNVLTTFQSNLTKKKQEKMKAESGKNKLVGDNYLKENAKKEGVVVLPSGLQYNILKTGTGKTPVDSSTVTTHYKGMLIDGTVFDDSYSRGEPASFPVNGVIKGWTEALKLMKEGDKWLLVIPADLAYGDRGAGNGLIPPGAVLTFEVELIKVND